MSFEAQAEKSEAQQSKDVFSEYVGVRKPRIDPAEAGPEGRVERERTSQTTSRQLGCWVTEILEKSRGERGGFYGLIRFEDWHFEVVSEAYHSHAPHEEIRTSYRHRPACRLCRAPAAAHCQFGSRKDRRKETQG